MKLHKEGNTTLILAGLILTLLNAAILYFGKFQPITWIPLSASLFLAGLLLNFFRNPNRNIQPEDSKIVSPADGTVVVIEETEETEFLNTRCIQISVFMSVWDVHINRFPVSGTVLKSVYRPGKYLLARNPKSSEKNEAHTTLIQTKEGKKLAVRQIAGIMARRVVCYAEENHNVEQGQELGFIKFGSRVDIFLPPESNIKVSLGDKLKGNISTIAEW